DLELGVAIDADEGLAYARLDLAALAALLRIDHVEHGDAGARERREAVGEAQRSGIVRRPEIRQQHALDAIETAIDQHADVGLRAAHDVVDGTAQHRVADDRLVPTEQYEIGALHRGDVADVVRRL